MNTEDFDFDWLWNKCYDFRRLRSSVSLWYRFVLHILVFHILVKLNICNITCIGGHTMWPIRRGDSNVKIIECTLGWSLGSLAIRAFIWKPFLDNSGFHFHCPSKIFCRSTTLFRSNQTIQKPFYKSRHMICRISTLSTSLVQHYTLQLF